MPLDNSQELFYLVDEQDTVLGSVSRGEAHSDSTKIHRAIDIVLLNDDGNILLQKRSQSKDTFPGRWTNAAGGHLTYGQSYDEAAQRELKEEIGLETPLQFIGKALVNLDHEQEYVSMYKGQTNVTPTKLDPDEVQEVAWFSVDEIKQMITNKELTPSAVFTLEFLKII